MAQGQPDGSTRWLEARERAMRIGPDDDIWVMGTSMDVTARGEAERALLSANVALTEAADQRTPIVAVTANALDGIRDRCIAADRDDYLTRSTTLRSAETVLHGWVHRDGEPGNLVDVRLAG